MKTRLGFVSNSSSSSFIVAYKKAACCPTCGLTPPDIVDLVEKSKPWSFDDNRVMWTDPKEKLQELEQEIESYNKDIESLKKRDPKEKISNYCTVEQNLKSCEEQVIRFSRLRQLIRDHHLNGDKVACVSISHHDSLNDTVRELEKTGQFFILECEE